MDFNIISFGCKVNSYESEYMKEQLLKSGYNYNEDYKFSDIVIVNTCSVTNTADNKCKKMIRSVRRENSKCILMVCGCTSENNRDKLNELDIDIMIGNNEKSKVVELIENFIKDLM
jgi:threonylcarbamoyladenosine tRNA methylthiotransferase MtaB